MIQNPVLKGFNPDPSILRVGDDYYLATSTFEWFPGVQIHHSTDLLNWSLVTRPLNRLSQLNLAGNANSGGVWAPCLSHHGGVFYLVYTDMKAWRGMHKEALNFVVTAPAIDGPWSDPVFLTGTGFDPSFYHEDGRSYLLHMQWNFEHEIRPEGFDGIVIQEYDKAAKRLVGPKHTLMTSTPMGSMEGPHIYRHDGRYYLMTAEGGTEYGHAVTMGRSEHLFGPYELDPLNPMLSSRGHPELSIQKAGHASLVETQDGEWYLAHLCGRPVVNPATGVKDRCILGRETALQKCCWKDGWLRLANGTNLPDERVEAPSFLRGRAPDNNTGETQACGDTVDNFDRDQLGIDYQSLRIPIDEHWCTWNRGRGLSLRGQGPLTSNHHQSIIARRVQSFNCEVETAVSFSPENYHQMAGLAAFYDTSTHYYLYVSHDPSLGRCLKLLKLDRGVHTLYEDCTVSVPETGCIRLAAELNINTLQFSYSADPGDQWLPIGSKLDASILSDDHLALGFTGAFFGMAVQDLESHGAWADFPYFRYANIPGAVTGDIQAPS